jgi:predicted permease
MSGTRVWNKIRARFGRSLEDGLDEEMRLHRQMIEEQMRADGLSAAEARNRASREFGPMALALESSRAEWSFAWLEALWSDSRYAVRALLRDRAFAFTAVLTLAVGLALASLAFTLFNAYVLRPFAVRDPGSLFEVHWLGKDRWVRMHPWRDYEEIRARTDVFADVLASRGVFVSGATRHWSGKLVTGNYFRMLGARIEIGREIEERDTRTPLGDNVVVIGYQAWENAFGRDPGVLGKTLSLRGHTYEVIGVASREFAGLDESPPDFWVPISMHAAFRKEQMDVEVIGRLRDGVGKRQAEAALAAMAAQGRPDARADLGSRATVVTFTPVMIFFFAPVLLALALVLATCCANVANMLLARGLARQREIGIRLSVGAGRWRLVRQLLTEAVVIAALAGAAGAALARVGLEGGQRIFFATAAPEFAKLVRLHSLEPDYRVFLFALGAAAVCAVGAALLPALQATRPNLVAALRGEFSSGFRASRLRDGLVVLQVVVCAVLMVCGALLYRRAEVFQTRDTGMREHGVIYIGSEGRGEEFATELRARADVEAVAWASRAPWFGRLNQTTVIPSGKSNPVVAGYNLVSPSYLNVFGIGLKAGRPFTDEDARTGAPVAIVSEATARVFWPGENPVGKTIRAVEARERYVDNLPVRGDIRVIGVSSDVIHGWVFDGPDPICIYLPVSAASKKAEQLLALVRGDERATLDRLRRWLLDRWPDFPGETIPMSMVLEVQIYPFRAAAWLGWVLGGVAMALTISGMYGVMSYLVNQRSKEIGIRVALGASPGGVMRMVLRRSIWLAGAGVAIGGALAGIAIKLLLAWSSGLGMLVWDNFALLSGAGLAGITAVLAALGPSSRAARVDPNQVLRAD